ncbi:hypothetical protein GYMLUDRAFT_822992 [Collybiopsis luxurians FD-317 M1]|uniref:Uncharacterized protein n=1 Tax=Collybiopsis luxurians FD-317 M1 TaxID=944289 RepID=A0A0D0C1U8_9AGAR|nr:hypothetical protein GYMLUDRAFT_822992 [Collybiopsis luxurians FD-317 M1]
MSEDDLNEGTVYATHSTLYTDLLKPTTEATLKGGIKTNRTLVRRTSVILARFHTDFIGNQSYGVSTGMFDIDTAVSRQEGTIWLTP